MEQWDPRMKEKAGVAKNSFESSPAHKSQDFLKHWHFFMILVVLFLDMNFGAVLTFYNINMRAGTWNSFNNQSNPNNGLTGSKKPIP